MRREALITSFNSQILFYEDYRWESMFSVMRRKSHIFSRVNYVLFFFLWSFTDSRFMGRLWLVLSVAASPSFFPSPWYCFFGLLNSKGSLICGRFRAVLPRWVASVLGNQVAEVIGHLHGLRLVQCVLWLIRNGGCLGSNPSRHQRGSNSVEFWGGFDKLNKERLR